MDVKISDYGVFEDKKFIEYNVFGLSENQMNYLDDNLVEETKIEDEFLKIKMYFDDELYPFQSDVAKIRIDDFISREEIEMNVFLSSFLEDMQ
ncbi:DUF5750 family protein [uncultured Methanobrevibacter sp.]|uniref:DUF5750 family protein n=1 Tax=uncultured Methanobrevibacter sp. TaxID=253161 RepID=UPI0025EDE531|nr:DUF5750 family protein [uncultured Methanobrevibacter sp.]